MNQTRPCGELVPHSAYPGCVLRLPRKEFSCALQIHRKGGRTEDFGVDSKQSPQRECTIFSPFATFLPFLCQEYRPSCGVVSLLQLHPRWQRARRVWVPCIWRMNLEVAAFEFALHVVDNDARLIRALHLPHGNVIEVGARTAVVAGSRLVAGLAV